ncbi:ImmA/IrrE family metallo-endopeptidase [Lactobacillus helveticus]|nr:ImmA/IrrE family metallo-endopeptidase [Lactobacillus helveticus]MCT0164429.1 ImmA/IrrE family metallo-endopeptidase [Lactobacillus helveticus]
MDNHLKRMIKKYHAEVDYIQLERPGYLARGVNGLPNIIFVNSKLPSEKAEQVIIHELGHLMHDHESAKKYSNKYSARIICESGANNFMIRQQVKKYIALGNNALDANWLNLANYIGTNNYWLVREELLKYKAD